MLDLRVNALSFEIVNIDPIPQIFSTCEQVRGAADAKAGNRVERRRTAQGWATSRGGVRCVAHLRPEFSPQRVALLLQQLNLRVGVAFGVPL